MVYPPGPTGDPNLTSSTLLHSHHPHSFPLYSMSLPPLPSLLPDLQNPTTPIPRLYILSPLLGKGRPHHLFLGPPSLSHSPILFMPLPLIPLPPISPWSLTGSLLLCPLDHLYLSLVLG